METVDKILLKYPPETHQRPFTALMFAERLDMSDEDVLRIAQRLIVRLPFKNQWPYRVLAENLPVEKLLGVFDGKIPDDEMAKDLVRYYLRYIISDVYGRDKLEEYSNYINSITE